MEICKRTLISLFSLLIILSCSKEEQQASMPTLCETLNVSYMDDILPIMENSCGLVGCHDYNFEWGNFLEYKDLKEKAESGALWVRISLTKTMPPSPLPSLSPKNLETIRCWLDDGALEN